MDRLGLAAGNIRAAAALNLDSRRQAELAAHNCSGRS